MQNKKSILFYATKISISEWIEFLLYLFGYESIQEISKSNKNSSTTTKFWLKKLFLVLEHYQDNIVLLGAIYIDEMFYKVIKKDVKYAGVVIDNTKVYVKVEGLGKTNDAKTLQTFTTHIKEKSHLIHDKEKSHNSLINKLSLTHNAYDGNELKKLEDKDNPLDSINKVINLIQKLLNSHSGFNMMNYKDI